MHPPEDVRRDIAELIEIAPRGLGSLRLSRVLGINPGTLRYWQMRYGTEDPVRVTVSKQVRDGLWAVLQSDLDHTVAVRLTLGMLRLARLQLKVDQLPEGADPDASAPSIRDAIAFIRTNLEHADPSLPTTIWLWERLGQAEADLARLLAGERRDPELSPAQLGLADDEDDVPLFDATGLVATPSSLSVGELLQDADAAARDLLFAPEGHQAAAMVRSWTPLVSAAANLLQTLPGPAGAGSDLSRELLERGRSLAAAAEDLAWPAPGVGDLRLDQITSNLDTAARLIRDHPLDVHDRAHGPGPAALADVDAARAAALHALHMATHAVGIALREHVEEARITRPDRPSVSIRGAGWRQRAEALEQLLQPELLGFPRALAGVPPTHSEESSEDRLPAALEAWRVHVDRVLANNPNPASLALIAKVQGMTAAPTAILISAGVLAEEIVPDRVAQACQETGTAWSSLADRWRDLAETHTSDPALSQAAAELRAACRELTHNPDGPAIAEQLTARPGIATAARALLDTARHGPELAARFLQATADPELRGTAAAMLRRTEEEAERSGLTTYDRPSLRARGLIAPTALVRQALIRATATTARNAATLDQAAQIHPGTPSPSTPPGRQPAALARDDVGDVGDLENVSALAAELDRAQRLCEELEEKLAAVKAMGASLADRWSSSTWHTTKLDTAIAAIAESTAGLSDVEALNSALQQLEDAVAEAHRLGEVIDDVGAYGTFPGPS